MNRFLIVIFILFCFKTEAQTSVLIVADSLFANGNYSKAIETYKTYNNREEVYHKMAKAYKAIGNYDQALLYYENSIKAYPDNILVKYEYAKLLSKTKKFEKASSVFNQLIVIDSLNPNYHYELGLILETQQDSLSIVEYKKSFQLDSEHQKAIYKVAKYMLQKRKHDSVDYYLDFGLKTYENNLELISLKAQNYYWQHEYEEAIFYFEKLIILGESSQFIHEKLSFSYSEAYQPEKSIEHILIALKYDPKNTTNLFILGQLYEDVKNYTLAEQYYKIAIAIDDVPLDYEYSRLGRVLNFQKKISRSY
ncbi:tetratricopeptide repeat protein [Hanstruepera marina]|uniref:tetratricopeptide repeat protein n=1 Tax=Hanstruepera marina TaxID=2873265 RepID=UPI002102B5D5|nr:tetratricopeptide repeat protein [Hanstruepera marina]